MKTFIIYFVSILCFISTIISAQEYRETRAVWLTTNYKLDWPPNTLDEKVQKESLRNIFKNLKEKKLNTVYFQVRSNGTVLYNSKIEPFSPYLTGTTGVPTSYDPLKYAIELGKEFNLEVHAWVNMIRCFSGSNETFLKHPKHIRNAHPDWTVRVMDENGNLSYWLNPGYYRAQDYLVDILYEISNNYDVDGIHLDFFRYPNKNFEDEKHFEKYGLNISLEDWRRNNLTTILRKFNKKVKPKNPLLKIGATPIGIRKNLKGANGWEGYSSVFQDTETWLNEELVDYLAPQIYWDIEKNPKFEVLAKDWVNKSNNKNIILGLAAYKKSVEPEVNKMIEISRNIGAAGISFFRYENISSIDKDYFNTLAFPTNMPWKEKLISQNYPDLNCKLNKISNDEFMISWSSENNLSTKNYRGYALLLDGIKPIKLTSINKNKVKLKFGRPSKLMYRYSISLVDRLWNNNKLSEPLTLMVPYLEKIKKSSHINTRPILFKKSALNSFLCITSSTKQKISIDFINKEYATTRKYEDLNVGLNLILFEKEMKNLMTIRITYTDGKEEKLNIL